MSRPALFLLLVSIPLHAGCADARSSGATGDDAATADVQAAPPTYAITDSMFGIVVSRAQENCLQTVANLEPGKTIRIILFDRSLAIGATVGEPHAACGDGASADRRAYLVETYDLVPGDFGIAVLEDVKVTNNQTDLDGNGVPETYRVCTSAEGVHMTAWAGDWSQNQRIWHDYYYLGYDLITTCKDPETAGT